MTLERIDAALADWNRRLEAMADNLLWLQSESTYQMLTGAGGAARVALTGATAARVQGALGALPAVFQNFDLLHSTIGRAVEARKGLPVLFGGEQRLAEIEYLVFGKSIQMPVVDVPVAQRTLLGGPQSGQCVTPEELLAPMVAAFAAARDAVLAVDGAWQELAAEIGRAEAQLRAASAERLPELDEAERGLAQVREQVQADPLGALEGLKARVQPALARAGAAMAARAQGRREVEQGREQLARLGELRREAIAAAAEARAKIAGWVEAGTAPEERRLAFLGEWLERVDGLLRKGAMDRFGTEMRNWRVSADECVAQATQSVAASRGAVEARRELRGRLEALKAKARGRGLAERDDVAAQAKLAEALLATRPTNLAQAAEAVARYGKTLNVGTGYE